MRTIHFRDKPMAKTHGLPTVHPAPSEVQKNMQAQKSRLAYKSGQALDIPCWKGPRCRTFVKDLIQTHGRHIRLKKFGQLQTLLPID